MTVEEFQHRYHNYSEKNRLKAIIEAEKVNLKIQKPARIVAVDFGELGFGLMTKDAAEAMGLPLA